MFNVICLIISLIVIMILAYRGYSTIITVPIIAMLTVLIINKGSAHIMANYTEVYMVGFANFIKNYFPLFMTGAIFAKLMDEVKYAEAISSFITDKIGKKQCILAVVLCGAFLTYGGVSLFVVAFILYPIAARLFKDADIPKRLIPGAIALGSFTFTMTAMPGSPEIQNVIPIKYYGTDTFAAPLIGVSASLIMLCLGMTYLMLRAKSAKKNNEGYGNDTIVIASSTENTAHQLPSFIVSVIPILIIFVFNLFFSKVYYPRIDGSYLEKYNISLENVSGTWSVIIALVIADVYIIAVNFKKIKGLNLILNAGVVDCFKPLINSSAIIGYGSIIKALPVFIAIQEFIFNMSSNPIISEALSVNLICGLTASASGGLEIALNALAPQYLKMAQMLNISPSILHRIASLSSGGLDTLPHNGAVITTLAICGLTHKESYKDMFVTSVVIPILTTVIMVTICYFLTINNI